MSGKLTLVLCHSLVLSISLIMAGFLELAVRAFVSAGTENYILVVSFAVLAAALAAYFRFCWPLAIPEINSKSSRSFRRMASEGIDPRRPLLRGRVRSAVAVERRGKQRVAPLVD
jgi:hypothetical protein